MENFIAIDFSHLEKMAAEKRREIEEEERREKEARERIRRQNLWRAAQEMIPEVYKETLKENHLDISGEWGHKCGIARSYIRQDGRFISILGPTGVGKSTMAAVLCQDACLSLGMSCEWYRLDSLLMQIQQTFSNRWNGEKQRWNTQIQAIEELCRPKLLVLDDYNYNTDWSMKIIRELFARRYEYGKAQGKRITIITSNLQIYEYNTLFEKATADRIKSCQSVIEFSEQTPSRR